MPANYWNLCVRTTGLNNLVHPGLKLKTLYNVFFTMNQIQIYTHKWLRIAFVNLLIVALLGVLMRYKIAYSLPIIDQKNIMNAHSHFAFAGWISQALMVLMVNYLANQSGEKVFNKYRWIFTANLLTAYGMLLSFPWQGYNSISIIFSTLSIFVSYAFAFRFWKDISKLKFKSITHYWFSAALIFSVISSAGPFFLAYMMANNWSHPNLFLLALYYFLHFQYNGWFFFACAGLFSVGNQFRRSGTQMNKPLSSPIALN